MSLVPSRVKKFRARVVRDGLLLFLSPFSGAMKLIRKDLKLSQKPFFHPPKFLKAYNIKRCYHVSIHHDLILAEVQFKS